MTDFVTRLESELHTAALRREQHFLGCEIFPAKHLLQACCRVDTHDICRTARDTHRELQGVGLHSNGSAFATLECGH